MSISIRLFPPFLSSPPSLPPPPSKASREGVRVWTPPSAGGCWEWTVVPSPTLKHASWECARVRCLKWGSCTGHVLPRGYHPCQEGKPAPPRVTGTLQMEWPVPWLLSLWLRLARFPQERRSCVRMRVWSPAAASPASTLGAGAHSRMWCWCVHTTVGGHELASRSLPLSPQGLRLLHSSAWRVPQRVGAWLGVWSGFEQILWLVQSETCRADSRVWAGAKVATAASEA